MSSSTATRTSRLTQPAPASAPRPTARRTLSGPGCSVGGPADRPVLRIVADGERAPVVTRVLPTRPVLELVEPPVETRQVRLDDFFAAEYDGDDQRLQLVEPRRSGLRLTRRGRLAVLTVSVVAVLGLGFAAASASIANDHPEQTTVVTVTPGQTLWDISSAAAAGGDVRSMMSHIEALNHLDSASLQAGQHLRIPQ
ncbi:LysM peptidoglycan-binding domain-containing protein [Nocardioides cynanchi]|uniref:LysM peptidoglycan-binding domain-containing protein n=1 Tax=Nocardioides cynanchi TaxID=2558918 RepID=UPI001248B890|nr:LysM peptidoglycan-binding domain-containing protein [Nocardioides cynanchi]